VLLLAAAALWAWPLRGLPDAFQGGCVRAGLLFAAVWLAYDQVQRLPGWVVATFPVLLVLLIVRPRWFLYALPLVVALSVLGRRWKRG